MKRAIVIGASSGIGRGIALELAKDDYQVGIVARREKLLNQIVEKNPERFISKSFDITETEKLEKQLEDMVSELDGLDLIVISAGLALANKELDSKIEKYVIDCNVVAFSIIANWGYRYFAKHGGGQIVGISSVAGIRGWRFSPKYNASKAYQMNYLEGLRIKSGNEKSNVIVTDIRPGYVQTDIIGNDYTFWVVPVEKVVPHIVKAIKRKKRVAYVPRRWRFVVPVYRIFPTRLLEKG